MMSERKIVEEFLILLEEKRNEVQKRIKEKIEKELKAPCIHEINRKIATLYAVEEVIRYIKAANQDKIAILLEKTKLKNDIFAALDLFSHGDSYRKVEVIRIILEEASKNKRDFIVGYGVI